MLLTFRRLLIPICLAALAAAIAVAPGRASAWTDWLSRVDEIQDEAGSLRVLLAREQPFRARFRAALQGLYGADKLPDDVFDGISDRALVVDLSGPLARSRLFAVRRPRFGFRIPGFRISPNVLGVDAALWRERLGVLEASLALQGGFAPDAGPSAGQLAEATAVLEAAVLRVSAARAVEESDWRRAVAANAAVRSAAAAVAWRRLRASAAAGLLAADQPGLLLSELMRLRAPAREAEAGLAIAPRASALAAFASPDPNQTFAGEGLLQWRGDRPRVLVRPEDVEVRASRRALPAVYALAAADDCLSGCAHVAKRADARLFAIAIDGAEASLFLRDGKWIGHVFATPFLRGAETYASVEALGTELGRTVGAPTESGALVARSLFDHWLANAYRSIQRSGDWRRFVVATGSGAGAVTVLNTRSSLGFETSDPGFEARVIEPADPEFELLVAENPRAQLSRHALEHYVQDRARLLYEVSVRGARRVWMLGDPDRAPNQAQRIAALLGDVEPAIEARDWLRWSHAPPLSAEARAALKARAERIDAALDSLSPPAPAAERARASEIFRIGGAGAMAGYLINRGGYAAWTADDLLDLGRRAERLAKAYGPAKLLDDVYRTMSDVLRIAMPYAVERYLRGGPTPTAVRELRRWLKDEVPNSLVARLVAYAARWASGPDEYIAAFSRSVGNPGEATGGHYPDSYQAYADALRETLPSFLGRLPAGERADFLEQLGRRASARYGPLAFRAIVEAAGPSLNGVVERRALERVVALTPWHRKELAPILAERAPAAGPLACRVFAAPPPVLAEPLLLRYSP